MSAPTEAIGLKQITNYQACYYAHELTRMGTLGELDRLSATLFDSKVDLNPHQVDAALFALSNPLQKGVILADEVGLGKTIEAGLVLCQKWAERKRKLCVIAPAHIRKQWQAELLEKFNLPSIVMDRKVWNSLRKEGYLNPFDCGKIVVISYPFAARMKDELRAIPFDLVVLDEAHKLRNAYQPSRTSGQAIRWAFELREKLLLSATPLQNSLMELYGLGWVIDDHVFGDRSSFQTRYTRAGGDLLGLRKRMQQFCKRTLRQDCAYVNYTKRQALTHPFNQTIEEKKLYDDVTSFMLREDSYAFPQRQRQLIEMILFKSLASSPMALASTLRRMRQRLIDIRDHLNQKEDAYIDQLLEDDDVDLENLGEYLDEFDSQQNTHAKVVDGTLLADELADLESLIERADQITCDSKAKALLGALKTGFSRLGQLGAAKKVLIFTESLKTQAFLADYLEANGYAGKVVTFSGRNAHPRAKDAYERFVSKHAGTDKLTGSKAIDIRSALIEAFRDTGEIMLATEAAAEGVNLQFCSFVINYDLPWNPQRVEQRIGRCHRYGQKYDVVVLNFLSRGNLADQRVQDLLQQKFSLFDGLFGASDDVLGAIEGGIDFEKRVLEIMKNCRKDDEIELAFNKLQEDLETVISGKMDKARQQLLEHFDTDVHERLKVDSENAQIALDRVGRRFWELAKWGLADQARFNHETFHLYLPVSPANGIPDGSYRLISAARSEDDYAETEAHLLRLSCPLGQWVLGNAKEQVLPAATLQFDLTNHDRKVSMLESYMEQSGWMRVEKLTLDSDTREEYLLLTAMTDRGDNLDQEQIQHLLDISAKQSGQCEPAKETLERLDADAGRLRSATISKATQAGNGRFKQAIKQMDQWADDKVEAAEVALSTIKLDLRAVRRRLDLAETAQAQGDALKLVHSLEKKQKQARQKMYDIEDEVEEQREQLIQQLRKRCEQHQTQQELFTIRFEIV
ncbi:DEAD/DEAH box helicase family protein [Planctomycetota bacterium]|nr:DEAD/DEAH box helicase family protein [Planctomycetota bacterium]